MPTIKNGDKVLVSGANGYIAMWVVRTLLERGYAVRGTVRNADKAKFVEEYFAGLGFADKLEVVVVDDIVKEGAFDEAVKGVDAIAHTASPFHPNAKTPDDLNKPAVQGTLGMLNSALKHGTNVKRIVVTSSCAAVLTQSSTPMVFSEADWNEASIKDVETLGDAAHPMSMYRASKTLAEKAAWGFVDAHKTEVGWDLAVINPPFVFGPAIHDVTSITTLNLSLLIWTNMVMASMPKPKDELLASNAWVDVRDIALGHVLALENPDAGGERIIVTAGPYIWQEWLDVANGLPENPIPKHPLNKGDPTLLHGEKTYLVSYDTTKQERILGIKMRTMLQTTQDTLDDIANKGW